MCNHVARSPLRQFIGTAGARRVPRILIRSKPKPHRVLFSAHAKQPSKRKRRSKALPVLGAAGLSFSLVSGASGGPTVNLPTPNTGARHEITLAEEEISDVSLATFYVFDKENAGAFRPNVQLVRGGGCGGGGCGGRGCGGCVTVTLPKPMTSGARRFGKQDFRYVAEEDVYICPAGNRLAYSFTTQEHGLVLHRYLTNVCQRCAIKHRCTTGKERRITRWEHEHILEAVQRRLDEHPEKMRQRRETVEHPFGTIKARMGATHFLMKTLPRVASEMALHVLAYNLTRVMNIMGIGPLMAAIRA